MRWCRRRSKSSPSLGARHACGTGRLLAACAAGPGGGAERRAGELASAPITVGDGVWIGARTLVLPGVTIGDGVIIAGGSVVVHDCEPNRLYAGVPARPVKELFDPV